MLIPRVKPQMYQEALDRQIKKLNEYAKGKADLSTKTKYFSQRDNYRDAHRTCNSSTNAMYLDWLMRATGMKGLEDDKAYIKKVFARGDTIYHGIQTQVIKSYGFSTFWNTDRDFPFLKVLLNAGFPVPVNIWHRGTLNNLRGGHVILLIGYSKNQFVVHDPYGTLESNYHKHDGAYNRIPEKILKIRWQGGYRMLKP